MDMQAAKHDVTLTNKDGSVLRWEGVSLASFKYRPKKIDGQRPWNVEFLIRGEIDQEEFIDWASKAVSYWMHPHSEMEPTIEFACDKVWLLKNLLLRGKV